MVLKVLTVLVLSLTLTACNWFRSSDLEPDVVPEPVVEIEDEGPAEPVFETEIDDDSAFEEALGEVSIQEATTFQEVIDDIDADSVQAAEPGSKLAQALTDEANAEEVAQAEIREAARQELQNLNAPTGLQIRPYSDELYAQVEGVRPAILYFTAEDCDICTEWEAGIRAQAEAFADMNALILLADIEAEADLAAEMRVTEPGNAMMLTTMGEIMGPRTTDRLTVEDIRFIMQ